MGDDPASLSVVRRLIYIPIVHTTEDLGSLGGQARSASLQKLGRTGYKRKAEAIDSVWTQIEQTVRGLEIPWERVRLYQDGLPVCGRESEVVREMAESGSRNYRLVQELAGRGATLMGTESLELLMEEYDRAKKLLADQEGLSPKKKQADLDEALLHRRDLFIAKRINETLRSGEIGLLFLGVLHSLEDGLDQDIEVVYPLTRPVVRKPRKRKPFS
jgi:hypothetical protein